jgi:hypothetical protein
MLKSQRFATASHSTGLTTSLLQVVEVTEDLQREHMSIAIIGILHMALYR